MECPQCNIPVATCYLPEHLRRFHLPDNGLVCPIESCGSLVESGDSDLGDHEFSKLQKHIETIHGELGLEWCFPCKEFVIDLAEHNKLRHEVTLPLNLLHALTLSYSGKLMGGLRVQANVWNHAGH